MEEYITVREYAKIKNISTKRVYQLVKKHRLDAKKIAGKLHVNNTSSSSELTEQQQRKDALYNSAEQIKLEKLKIENELKKQRLKNVRQDTILKHLKNQSTKEKYRVEYAEEVLQVYITSFASLKSFITSLHLDADQLKAFQQHIEKCVSQFELNLSKYLRNKDKEQIEDED